MPIGSFLFISFKVHILLCLVVSCTTLRADGGDEAMVGWVWDDGTRSTFDILWSCLAVVIVCTYKVIHLNLPSHDESKASWLERLFWRKWLRKIKWMGFMALSPELLLCMGFQDWLWSRDSVRKFRELDLTHPPSLPRHSKSIADVIESKEAAKTSTTVRTMPCHVPLRYPLIKV